MNKRIVALFVVFVLFVAIITTSTVNAIRLGDVIKVGGIAIIVKQFGPQIDDFINKITGQKNLGTKYDTKVVPIMSLGDGGYVGAAQVAGPKAEVEKTKAVLQLEDRKVFGSPLRIRALIPVDAESISNVKRVDGVGVSALIDLRI
ncbi:MAG: hypothetical protein SNJ70_00370 [Armatimonadota bacterium]